MKRMLLIALAAMLLVTAATASARRAPTASEKTKIARAIHRSPDTQNGGCFHVRGIVVSTKGPWARAKVVPCKSGTSDPAVAAVQRSHGRWKLRELGTFGVGCDIATKAVRRDLRFSCPSQ